VRPKAERRPSTLSQLKSWINVFLEKLQPLHNRPTLKNKVVRNGELNDESYKNTDFSRCFGGDFCRRRGVVIDVCVPR
jgi:hypothetical protein